MPYLCTKQFHFAFNNNIYIQCDRVDDDDDDDIHAYVELTKVEFILNKLNNYYPNINFTFELEKNNEINFLDVLMKRVYNNKLETDIYRKPTSSNIYINWKPHAPTEWKIGMLRNLIKQAKMMKV